MAGKKKASANPFVSQFMTYKKLNQRLRLISDLYYIHNDGRVFLHSNLPFVERIITINNENDISSYYNTLGLPNTAFDFTKTARKTKLVVTETQNKIYMSDSERTEAQLELNRMEITDPITNLTDMYNHLDILLEYMDESNYIMLNDSIASDIIDGTSIDINIDDYTFTVTKNIFPSLKGDDSLFINILPIKDTDNPSKTYVIFKEVNPLCTIHTLAAFMVTHN